MTLGARIAKLRRINDVKQEDLAKQVGLHITHVSRLENDKIRPRPQTLARIAKAFGMTVDQLLEDENGKHGGAKTHDPKIVHLMDMVAELDAQDRDAISRMVHALVTKKRMEETLAR